MRYIYPRGNILQYLCLTGLSKNYYGHVLRGISKGLKWAAQSVCDWVCIGGIDEMK